MTRSDINIHMDNLKRLQKLAGISEAFGTGKFGEPDFDPRLIKALQAIATDLGRSVAALDKVLTKIPPEKGLQRGSAKQSLGRVPLKGKVAAIKASIQAFQKDVKNAAKAVTGQK